MAKLNFFVVNNYMSLKINEGIDVHINKFNKCITYLLSVKVNIDEEDETTNLLASLPKSYETLVTTLLMERKREYL